MIQFKPYNITINGSNQGDEMGKDDSPRAKAYEERVRLAVNAISIWRSGKALLSTMNARVPLWIVPYRLDDCNAMTGPYYPVLPDGKKGYIERILYSPDHYSMDECGWYPGMRPEEVLFHEMVHANRDTNNPVRNLDPLEDMQDYEEFFATMVTNVYRSEQGAKKFHRDYVYKELVNQVELELFLSSKGQYIDALEYFLEEELVKAIIPLPMPFNPFRDFERLKGNYSVIAELMNQVGPQAALRKLQEWKWRNELGKKLTELQRISQSGSWRAIHKR